MESQENSNVMQSSVPVNLEPKVESVVPEKPEKKPSKMNGMVIGTVILVVCLVLGLTYYVLKDNGTDLLALGKQTDTTTGSETEDSSTTDSTTEEENTDSTTCEETGTTSCEVNVDNEGWALYSLPEYEFSIEIPSYDNTFDIFGDKIYYKWGSTHYDGSDKGLTADGLLDSYLHSADISFHPTQITENLICEAFCPNEHSYTIDIYSNTGERTLQQVSESYYSNWNKLVADEMNGITNEGISEKWNMNVSEYTKNVGTGSWNGYIVVTKDFVYDVYYHIDPETTESESYGQKVLDSMKFGE